MSLPFSILSTQHFPPEIALTTAVAAPPLALEMRHITKTFPGVRWHGYRGIITLQTGYSLSLSTKDGA